MRILGIDTATWCAAVGLWEDGRVVADQKQQTTGNHAVALLGMIDSVLNSAGWGVESLSAIGVAAGPGSFTGLRVGLSTAKGLAFARNIDLVAVPTLTALAATVQQSYDRVTPILDARKDELYAASFRVIDGRLTADLDACLITPARLFERLPAPGAVLGDALLRYTESFAEAWGGRADLLPFETHGPRGSTVARLAAERLAQGPADPLAAIEPFYIRQSEAETKRA